MLCIKILFDGSFFFFIIFIRPFLVSVNYLYVPCRISNDGHEYMTSNYYDCSLDSNRRKVILMLPSVMCNFSPLILVDKLVHDIIIITFQFQTFFFSLPHSRILYDTLPRVPALSSEFELDSRIGLCKRRI